jgi:hypothetical protein
MLLAPRGRTTGSSLGRAPPPAPGALTQVVHPEEVALMCLSAALVVPPGGDAGWGEGFDSQAAQARLADFLLDELLVGLQAAGSHFSGPIPKWQRPWQGAGWTPGRALLLPAAGVRTPGQVDQLLMGMCFGGQGQEKGRGGG